MTNETNHLFDKLYEELHRIAKAQMCRESPSHALQTTAIVHEAYLKLSQRGGNFQWNNKSAFLTSAAEAMRQILIDSARHRKRLKRGGDAQAVELADTVLAIQEENDAHDILALDEVLRQFESIEPQKAELVKLRYFAGLTIQEAADVLGISRATATRHWQFARAWLYSRLGNGNSADGLSQPE